MKIPGFGRKKPQKSESKKSKEPISQKTQKAKKVGEEILRQPATPSKSSTEPGTPPSTPIPTLLTQPLKDIKDFGKLEQAAQKFAAKLLQDPSIGLQLLIEQKFKDTPNVGERIANFLIGRLTVYIREASVKGEKLKPGYIKDKLTESRFYDLLTTLIKSNKKQLKLKDTQIEPIIKTLQDLIKAVPDVLFTNLTNKINNGISEGNFS